ncbi:group II intron maturase-specific domain-containing protein [Arthrobacter glacialis]|uniref:group II intron maturase-specific domain-containing protein n=1 Tax=Arthrobacter glacialis TaxID=1664 RepID=UPI001A9F9E95
MPVISRQSLKRVGREVRHWRLRRRIHHTLDELARAINTIVTGWMQSCGRFYRTPL